jgi:putative membrane protein
MTAHDLPPINASLNGLSGIFILLGWWYIKRQAIQPHIACMACALVSSALFLACYLTYHYARGGVVTRFTAEGPIRAVYLSILISHTSLAVVTVPLVIATVVPALRARYDKHRRLAAWALPIWLYVSVTGVIVYFMLYHWFPSAV